MTSKPRLVSFIGFTSIFSNHISAAELNPVLDYRQAVFETRENSPFTKSEYKNYADQLYLSLFLRKEIDFLSTIHFEPAVRTVRDNPGVIETVIDQGFIQAQKKAFGLVAGKKKEVHGAGFFVRPSDILNEDEDLFDDFYRREGLYLSQVFYQSGSHFLGLGYVPWRRRAAEEGRVWLRGATEISGFEMDLQYTFNKEDLSTVGFALSKLYADLLQVHLDMRWKQKLYPSGETDSKGQRPGRLFLPERVGYECDQLATKGLEDLCMVEKNESAGVYYNVGTRWSMTQKRSLVFEWIQQQSGLSQEELEPYYAYQSRVNDSDPPPNRLLSNRYVFVGYLDEQSIKDSNISLHHLLNIDDNSQFVLGQYDYAWSEGLNIAVAHGQFVGKKNTEFGEKPLSSSWYFRVQGRF
jgi:hypothetical protein